MISLAATVDIFRLDEVPTGDERAVRNRVRAFGEQAISPVINDYWERAAFPFDLLPGLAALGICGGALTGDGCPGLSQVGIGLAMRELARADGSLATFFGAQTGLVMGAISQFGSAEQRARWLPPLARLDQIGAFALTEPDHGSDVAQLQTRARRDGNDYVLDGAKRSARRRQALD